MKLPSLYLNTLSPLLSLSLGLLAIAPAIATPIPESTSKPAASHPVALPEADTKIFDTIIDAITGGDSRFCIASFCIDAGEITEELLTDQLSDLVADHAPITISTESLYPTRRQLPSAPFDPVLLYLVDAAPDVTIPPGDYVYLVQVHCLQSQAASPNRHRYQLAQFGGTRQAILQDLNGAIATGEYAHGEIQGLSWFIQSGGRYDDMPRDMQALVNTLIPHHQEALDSGNFLNDLRSYGEMATSALGYYSFDAFLRQELGDVGGILVELMALEAELRQPQDWRTLSQGYFAEPSSSLGGSVLDTPWSEIAPNLQARFMIEGNYDDIGVVELRVLEEATPLTVADFEAQVTSWAAIPEGAGNTQPLAIAPLEDPSWFEEFAIGFGDLGFFAGRQLCGAAERINRRVEILCEYLSEIQDVLRPDTPAGFPELSDIPDLGGIRRDRRRQNETEERDRPDAANDNRRPPEPANDNNPLPTPANDNIPPDLGS